MNILDINAKNIQLLKEYKNKNKNKKSKLKRKKKKVKTNKNDKNIENIKIYRFYPKKKLLTYNEKLKILEKL